MEDHHSNLEIENIFLELQDKFQKFLLFGIEGFQSFTNISNLGGIVVREIYVISFINLSCFYPLINPILSSFSMIFCAHSSTSKPSVSKITSGLIGTL